MRPNYCLPLLLLIFFATAHATETLEEYVEVCKKELGFEKIPQFDCRGDNFDPRNTSLPFFDLINDWVAHRRINDSVDAVFACRWVDNNTGVSGAASGEMIVHNRRSGKTCFFEIKESNPDRHPNLPPKIATTNPVSPTHSKAAGYWDNPEETRVCTDCHVAGPYIASPKIVGALAKYGLINDKHDTYGTIYQAIGSQAKKLNALIKTNREVGGFLADCSKNCHIVGGDISSGVRDFSENFIIPPLTKIIDDIVIDNHMPPDNPKSDYRWINRDDAGKTGDWERMIEVKDDYPQFYCSNPKKMEARVVDSDVIYRTDFFSNNIRTFNLQEGFMCYNEDQPTGKTCGDYETRYKCNGEWMQWFNNDKPTGVTDNESRNNFPKLCANPTAIQARMIISMAPLSLTTYVTADGPPDRLSQFDKNGLVCKNEDQDDGKCSNYVVRFHCR